MRLCLRPFCLVFAALLAGCAVSPPRPDPAALQARAAQWQAPLPPANQAQATVSELLDWWSLWQDPTLTRLQQAAQAASPSLDAAAARIRESRAQAVVTASGLWPQVSLSGVAQRSKDEFIPPGFIITRKSLSLDAQWEIDLWGGVAAAKQGALAQVRGREAAWHDARISLAAEVAQVLTDFRACRNQHAVETRMAQSHARSLQRVQSQARAGLASAVQVATAQAARAEAEDAQARTAEQCALGVKALVTLTGFDETLLQSQLASDTTPLAIPPAFTLDRIPAAVLLHRPDVRLATQGLEAAAAEVAVAEVARYPSISLQGMVGLTGKSWLFGPVLQAPLFNAGKGAAHVEAARARYEEALANTRQQVLKAVQDVETALVRLNTARQRSPEVQRSLTAFRLQRDAANARQRVGSISALDSDDAERQWLAAQIRELALQQETVRYWIALYKAVGGGWKPTDCVPLPATAQTSAPLSPPTGENPNPECPA